ncbi:fimbria/pilus periplasmic chaperone [Escherichia coli]|nr:fimbria/pilus periplasmic chaperone [Escherichia coli]MED0390333.1 fimbria/pilus periplasmic chaperone [Escherichia coli]
MKITVKDSRIFYFTIYNDTDNEYIITARVIRENGSWGGPFVLSPPARHLNKRDNVKIGIIYLSSKKESDRDNVYYLSVSFIPRQQKSVEERLLVPLILEQQIPIVVE